MSELDKAKKDYGTKSDRAQRSEAAKAQRNDARRDAADAATRWGGRK